MKRFALSCAYFGLSSLLLSALASAGVLVVDDSGGPGVNFTSIGSAVTAAADGDILLVNTGSYAGFSITGKSLVVTQAAGAVVTVNGHIEVAELPPGGSVVLRGLHTGTASMQGLLVRDCGGAVWVEGCDFKGSGGGTTAGQAGISIQNCDAVDLVRTEAIGGNGGTLGLGLPSGPGLHASLSVFAALGCVFRGGHGAGNDEVGGSGGHAALIESGSEALLSGCELHGGSGGYADSDFDHFCGCIICNDPGYGGMGLYIRDGSTVRTQELDITPGSGGFNQEPGCPSSPDGLAIFLERHSLPSTLQELPGTARSLRVSSPTSPGGLVNLIFDGEPGDTVSVVFSPVPATFMLPHFSGALLVGSPFTLLSVGPLNAVGKLVLPVVAPALPPGLPGVAVFVQGVFQPPAGPARLGSGSAAVLLGP